MLDCERGCKGDVSHSPMLQHKQRQCFFPTPKSKRSFCCVTGKRVWVWLVSWILPSPAARGTGYRAAVSHEELRVRECCFLLSNAANPTKSGNNCIWVLSVFIPPDLSIEIPVKELRIPCKGIQRVGFFYSGMVQGYFKDLGCLLMSPTAAKSSSTSVNTVALCSPCPVIVWVYGEMKLHMLCA